MDKGYDGLMRQILSGTSHQRPLQKTFLAHPIKVQNMRARRLYKRCKMYFHVWISKELTYSDNGKQFIGKRMREFCTSNSIAQIFMVPLGLPQHKDW